MERQRPPVSRPSESCHHPGPIQKRAFGVLGASDERGPTLALHILTVDDDADVLPVLVEMLRVSGFIVTAADSGIVMREILALLPIDAVILDSAMPGEPSAQLALHAKKLRLPVVMISGSPEAMKFADENHFQLLPKPSRIAELVDAIGAAVMSGEFGQRDA